MIKAAIRSMSERENILRALEFRSPDWIPVTFDLSESAWMKWGEALEAVVLRHPLVFPGYQRGSYPRHPTDPFHEVYESRRDD